MDGNTKDTGRLRRSTNRFPENIQECYEQFERDLAIGEDVKLPPVVQVILRLNDVMLSRPQACLEAVASIDKKHALEELDIMGTALIRASLVAGCETEPLTLTVCRSTFDDYSHAVGVAMCVHMLTPNATFRDIADLRSSVASVFDAFYGNMGLVTPYQSGRSDMYLTKYMASCAKSILGFYAFIPAALSHFDKEVVG